MTQHKLRRRFVEAVLVPHALSPERSLAINIEDEYYLYLVQRGIPDSIASEAAETQLHSLTSVLENYLVDWDQQGVPRPLTATDQQDVFLPWSHTQFPRYSGINEGIDKNYCEVLHYVRGLSDREFPVVCAIWLRCIGCETILYCDGPGDGGVDLLGRVTTGGLRSLAVAVQSKTTGSTVGRKTILTESSNYQLLLNSPVGRYQAYRDALQLDISRDGASWAYAVVTNSEFQDGARQAARDLRVMLRGARQVALVISETYAKKRIEHLVRAIAPVLTPDLDVNLWDRLSDDE